MKKSEGYISIAIDGPAGAGKSTIARAVGEKLGILCLDTGAMYRAMALKAIRSGVEVDDVKGVLALLEGTQISAELSGDGQRTFLDGEDVTAVIRTQKVAKGASDIGVIPQVRMKLAELQRKMSEGMDIVMDGREIGSYVLPNATHKFYVTASVRVRAERRLRELNAKGQYIGMPIEDMMKEIEARDRTDSTREFAPLVRVPDAALIDTTDMDIQTAVDKVMACIAGQGAQDR